MRFQSFVPVLLAAAIAASGDTLPQPVIDRILGPNLEQAASLAPGGVFVIEGQVLATETRLAAIAPLPTRLAATRVLVDGVECALLMVSPWTVYAQVPFGTVSKNDDRTVTVTLKNRLGDASTTVKLAKTQPVLLTQSRDGKGPAVMVDESLKPVYSPRAGDVVIVYLMGLGETTPGGETGLAGSLAEPQAPNETVEIFVGAQPAEMQYIGLAPGLAGTYQIKFRIPEGGGDTVLVRTEGTYETSASIPVAPLAGDSLQNVSGTVRAVGVTSYPTTFSPILIGAEFTLSMGVPPAVQPFDVVVDYAGGTLVKMTVNPADGSYEGTVNVPDVLTRNGDFSASGLTLVDFRNGGNPMPGNRLPASRMLPEYLRAFQLMTMPTGPSTGGVGAVNFRGEIPAGGQLEFSTLKTPGVTVAGVWQTVSKDTRSFPLTLRLVVNGSVVATQDVTLPVQ